MKFYFASSIKGSSSYNKAMNDESIISYLMKKGEVLAGYLDNGKYKINYESKFTDKEVHNRDIEWLLNSDAIIAEVSNPSLGVGYEIGRAVEHNIPVLCLFYKVNKKLSSMIRGCDKVIIKEYYDITEAKNFIDEFIEYISKNKK